MRKTLIATLGLMVVVGVLAPGCARDTDTKGPGAVRLAHGKQVAQAIFFIDVQGKKQTVYPTNGYIYIGDGAEETREVWWVFTHKSAQISFQTTVQGNPQDIPPIPQSACKPLGKAQVCVWTIQKKSLAKGFYKFILDGKNDANEDLERLDPDLEVDR